MVRGQGPTLFALRMQEASVGSVGRPPQEPSLLSEHLPALSLWPKPCPWALGFHHPALKGPCPLLLRGRPGWRSLGWVWHSPSRQCVSRPGLDESEPTQKSRRGSSLKGMALGICRSAGHGGGPRTDTGVGRGRAGREEILGPWPQYHFCPECMCLWGGACHVCMRLLALVCILLSACVCLGLHVCTHV